MVLKGVGPEEKLSAGQRKELEGKTASHLMFGFAGAERNCNPWHVRGVGWAARQGAQAPEAHSWP
jgi:hypothetical protein